MNATVPVPKCAVTIREATMDDLSFIDRLQKMHSKNLGFLRTKALEGKINAKQIVIAEESGVAVGYCIGQDQYFKREDVGIIYQLNVEPGKQRGFIGATLVKAMFDRAAYGCRLFCCWCAQDIEANYFWESLGFVPLAFRAGSRKRSRVHIFWQKRIRGGDTTTSWWLPTQTSGGAMGEDRIVLPIPPGTHWSDAKPLILPKETKMISDETKKKVPVAPKMPKRGHVQFGAPPPLRANVPAPAVQTNQIMEERIAPQNPASFRPKRVKAKNDPAMVEKVRELNARWIEQVNADPSLLEAQGKYEVSRQLAEAKQAPMLLEEAA